MNTAADKGKDLSLDLLRSAAIVYIIGFWHILEYSSALSFIRNDITLLLTNCVLALFFHISGFLLAKKNLFSSVEDIKAFYAKRFLRIYPMFIITLAGFLALKMISTGAFFRAALLTNMFTGEPLTTLWFVNLILIFYMITPLFLYRPGIGWILLLAAGLFAILAFLYGSAGLTDPRFAMFLPAYASGLLAARSNAVYRVMRPTVWGIVPLAVALTACSILFVSTVAEQGRFFITIMVYLIAIPIFRFSGSVLASFAARKFIRFICSGSYAAYLIHRITFSVFVRIYQPEGIAGSILYLAGICLTATFGAAYLFQKTYDSIISMIKRRFGKFHDNEVKASQR